MTTGKALNGMPYTGNPHVRFDDGEVVPAAVPRDGSSLCKRNTSFVFGVSCALWLAIVSCLVQSASAGTAFETQTGDTSVYTFGSPVGSGEEGWGNIGETTVNSNRFAFRSGTVNVKSGGYVRVNGYDTGDRAFFANWIGAGANTATLNIDGGIFWIDIGGASNDGAGVLRVGVNGGANDATVNLNSGVFRVDKYLHVGATLYSSTRACAKNVVVNISGGTAQIATLNLGASSWAAGASEGGGYADATLNLTGGTLEVAKFNFTAYHNQYFTWGGGTLKATAADIFSSTAISVNAGCTRTVSVTGNPAVFDTGNYAQTIPADIASGSGTLKLTGGNTVTLSAVPSFGLWLDGTTLVFASGLGASVTVPSITLGSGSAIVFDSDSMGQETSLTATGGFSLPDGGSVLDFVQVVGADVALCSKFISADGKTIRVMKSSSSDYIWNGGAAANWGDSYAWTFGNVAATWADGNNAIFSTANAMVTLVADASAGSAMFIEDATIAAGGGTLTVPTVSVAGGVSATIAAPISGAFEKTGAGTLIVTNRTDSATTLSDGTLAICNGASLDWSMLTLGTDATKPVTLDLAPNATLTDIPSAFYIGADPNITATVRKSGGDWSVNGTGFVVSRASGADTTFLHEGGTLTVRDYFSIGGVAGSKGLMIVSGGTVSSSSPSERLVIGARGEGSVIVTNNGTMSAAGPLLISSYGVGSLDVADGGTMTAKSLYIGGVDASCLGTANLSSGGTIELSGSVSNRLAVGRGTFNFNGGTLRASTSCTLIAAHNKLDVNVLANGGVIDNGGYAIAINKGIVGVGGITLKGAGTTTFSVDQGYAGATTVKSGTTLSAIGRTFAGPVVFESGANVLAPVVPEGEISVEVMTAASFSGAELLPKVGDKQFFVKGNRLMFGNKAGCMIMVF